MARRSIARARRSVRPHRCLGAPAVAAALLLGACGGGGGDTPRDTAAGDASSAVDAEVTPTTAPASGPIDRVVWNIPFGEPGSLDPLRAFAPGEQTVLPNVCDALLRIGPDLTIEPGLAERWKQVSPTRVRFTLRENARFWNGNPVSIEDVLYSLERHLDPELGSYYDYWASQIKRYEQTGPREVTLQTKVPDAYVHKMLATGLGTVVEKRYAEARGKEYGTPQGGIMCSGPFELERWDSGQRIVLTANEEYWDAEHRPHAETFEFTFLTDPTTLVNALASGEIDGSYEVPVQGIAQLRTTGTVAFGLNLNMGILQPMQQDGPSADPRVREALSLAIDRAGIAQTVFKGLAAPQRVAVPTDSFVYATERYRQWYAGAGVDAEPDLERARQLVEEAGSPSQVMTIGVQTGDSQSAAVAAAIQSAAKEIGLRLEVRTLPAAQYQSLVFSEEARAGIDWSTGTTNYINIAEPLEVLFVWAISSSPFNLSGFNSPELDALFADARAEADPERRAELVIEAFDLWDDPPNNIPLYVYPSRLFLSNRISGAPTSFTTYNDYPWAADVGAR
jgi:peptide/nickel transport system substrate-binding protein